MPQPKQLSLQRLEFISQLFSPEVMFNATEAYRRAYPKCKGGHDRLAHRLMSKDEIKQHITKKRAQIAKKTGFTIERALELYEETYLIGKDCKQPAAMNGSVLGMARLFALDKDAGVKEQVVIVIGPKVIGGTPRKAIESEVIEQ